MSRTNDAGEGRVSIPPPRRAVVAGEGRMQKGRRVERSLFCLLLLFPVVTGAAEISVGGVAIEIPAPTFSRPLPSDMTVLRELERQAVLPTNDEFIAFFTDADMEGARPGQILALPATRFTVQMAKSLAGVSVTAADFAKMKSAAKQDEQQRRASIAQVFPKLIETSNEGIPREYDLELVSASAPMIPLPVHDETDRTLAYSVLAVSEKPDASGALRAVVETFTLTLVHTKKRVLYLYVHGEEDDLEWTRFVARKWARAVLAANSPEINGVRDNL